MSERLQKRVEELEDQVKRQDLELRRHISPWQTFFEELAAFITPIGYECLECKADMNISHETDGPKELWCLVCSLCSWRTKIFTSEEQLFEHYPYAKGEKP